MNRFHTPVLLKEILEFLNVGKGKKYIDATLGGGGHTKEILKLGGRVLGIDIDEEAIRFIKENFKFEIFNFKLVPVLGNFKDIDRIAHLNNFDKVSGIIFDLGVSSFQIDQSQRGFSYQKKGPLDMRMGKSLSVKAADLISVLSKNELYELFSKLGQERFARVVSGRIVRARRIKRIETTDDLMKTLEELSGKNQRLSAFKRALIGKRVFQALRIAVNDELNNLKGALPKTLRLLKKGGRLEVISFHSLEDRIVKDSFEDFENKNMGRIITKKPVLPTFEEVKQNKRSRSAKLRVFERL